MNDTLDAIVEAFNDTMAADTFGSVLAMNREHYPMQLGDIDDSAYTRALPTVTVLVQGTIDYAAYCGHGEPEWVAVHGQKLTFDVAKRFFPEIERSKYRD